jgi:hypothetical protein
MNLSGRLNESQIELKYLRDEIEVAQKAEADLRRAIAEIDDHAKRATQNHEAEKAKLQAALVLTSFRLKNLAGPDLAPDITSSDKTLRR